MAKERGGRGDGVMDGERGQRPSSFGCTGNTKMEIEEDRRQEEKLPPLPQFLTDSDASPHQGRHSTKQI